MADTNARKRDGVHVVMNSLKTPAFFFLSPMKIEIIKPIPEAGYWPGQIIINHAKEREWLRAGLAKPVVEMVQQATLKRPKPNPRTT